MGRVLLGVALFIFSLVPTISSVAPVSAQDSECELMETTEGPWSGVCKPVQLDGALLIGPVEGNDAYQGYTVQFTDEGASTNPNLDSTEFMVVRVRQGEFVLDLAASEANALSTPDPQVEFDAANPEVLISSQDPVTAYTRNYVEGGMPTYSGTIAGIYQPVVGDCTASCPVDPNIPVRLNAGDIAVVRRNTTCLWCALNAQNAFPPEDAEQMPAFEVGILDVFIVTNNPQSFSWQTDWERQVRLLPDPTLTTTLESAPAGPTRFGWAFNPGSNCRGG
jgi:hypothetical protein